MERVKNIDLYELLAIDHEADEAAIKKAYRKKALKCHPDKNPDDPKAAELFHQLSDALQVLTDEKVRKAYDQLLKARKANELRNRQLDSKRKRFKDDLEARERAAFDEKSQEVKAARNLEEEIERLMKEGKRQLEEEQARLDALVRSERELAGQREQESLGEIRPAKLKVKWRLCDKAGSNYDAENLRQIFCKYGDIGDVVVLPKSESKRGSGLVEMADAEAAKLAADIEKGFADNPFKVKLLLDKKDGNRAETRDTKRASTFDDYESRVMNQLSREEERKRLMEEIRRQDESDERQAGT